MKNIALLLLGLFLALPQFAQERKYSTFYQQRATLFEELPVTSRDIIFLGNSFFFCFLLFVFFFCCFVLFFFGFVCFF